MTNGSDTVLTSNDLQPTLKLADVVTSSQYKNKRSKPQAEQIKRDHFPLKYETNPDVLLSERRKTLDLYKRMMMDSCIHAGIQLRKDITLSANWHIDAPEDNPVAQDQAKFVKDTLDNLQTVNFCDVLDSLLDYEWLGFRIAERKWAQKDGRWVYADIKVKDSELFEFEVDDYGNLINIIFGYTRLPIYPGDAILAVFPYVDNGNFYGTSCLQAVYTEYFAKTTITKYRNTYLQNRASAPIQAVYPANDESARSAAATICDAIQNDFWTAIPGTRNPDGTMSPLVDIKLLEVAASAGTSDYDSAISQLDKALMRGLMVPDNLGFSDASSGSYAQSKTQLRSVLFGVQKRLDRLAAIVNQQVVRPLIEANFPEVADGVAFMFEDIDDDVSESRSTVIDRLVKAGIVDADESFVREYLNIPERAKEDIEDEPEEDPGLPVEIDEPQEMPEPDEEQEPTETEMAEYSGRYLRPVNFAEIAGTQDAIEKKMLEDMGAVFAKATPKMLSYIQRRVLDADDLGAAQGLRFDGVGEIRDILIHGMYQAYLSGKRDVAKDIEQYSGTAVAEFSECIHMAEAAITSIDFKGLGLTGIDNWLKQYGSKLTQSDKDALRRISQKAYSIACDDTIGQLLIDLRKTIKAGMGTRTSAQIIQDCEGQIDKFVNTAMTDPNVPGVSIEGALAIDQPIGRLSTIVRNATSTEYNQGAVAQALDPALKGFVQYAQYAAILDDATTPFCAAHDGEVLEVGEADFITLTPPNHHNCRSTWIFGFRGDDWVENWASKTDKQLESAGIDRQTYTNGPKGFGKKG